MTVRFGHARLLGVLDSSLRYGWQGVCVGPSLYAATGKPQ
jgi:hypothetical protein